jgi:KUP system potassium uptake protein
VPNKKRQSQTGLTLLALGVVFGDIGTSPLYAVKETFSPAHGIPLATENVIGGISAIFWALMLIVSIKYVILIMRADNEGEGGIMALIALASRSLKGRPQWQGRVLLLGVAGAALFYGDAVLTPAISVLSAVEGLKVGTTAFESYVLPIAVGVLIALFVLQRRGTESVGKLFGPVTALWFLSLAVVGVYNIARYPQILAALNPFHGIAFVTQHGFSSFLVLGAVLLAFTGAEALYADMGHFGKKPIRIAWFGLVFPALALNYFGQGALLAQNPAAIENPFYLAFPEWALYPMIVLATLATVIASQATISGAYSITKQAIQLGFLPRMNVVQTSAYQIGQVYIPAINWMLLAAVLIAVLGFGSSSGLASAYGVAVTGTMLIDTLLTFFVIRFGWNYNLILSLLATGVFAAVEAAFFSSSLLKIDDGGWFPLFLAAGVLAVMMTWRRGRSLMISRLRESAVPLQPFLKTLFLEPPPRVSGTAVFLTATPDAVPHALLHNLNHNKVLHERVVFLTVRIRRVPWLAFGDRVQVQALGRDCYRVILSYGFKNRPDVSQALTQLCPEHGLDFNLMQTSFFLSREKVIPLARAADSMTLWRERLFAVMARNANSVVEYFNIPANRVIELGTQVEI